MRDLDKLVKNKEAIIRGKSKMFCLPFAGGGASVFNGWIKAMKDQMTICPIQLPGREERIMEQPYIEMEDLVQDIVQAILPYMNDQVYIFGHSMGAKIAFEVEKELEKQGEKTNLLVISGSRVPHIPEPNPIYHLPDDEFERELGRFEGTPKEIMESKELLAFFLPVLRADFTLYEIYYSKDVFQLKCPILALGGENDREADLEEIKSWGMYTDSDFRYRMFKGGHFFIRESEDEVLDELKAAIRNLS
jgi:surfactin synthase thioesterase subunit